MDREELKKELIKSECKNIPSDIYHTSQILSVLEELKLEHHFFEKNINKAIEQVSGGLDYL